MARMTPSNRKRYGQFLLALFLLHTLTGAPLLPDLPKPAEPIHADWDRQEPDRFADPRYTVNSAPAASGAMTVDPGDTWRRWLREA